jgi:hypothetical protein
MANEEIGEEETMSKRPRSIETPARDDKTDGRPC